MTKRTSLLILLLISLVAISCQSPAAIKKNISSGPQASFNPKQDTNDIVLPMPNGLSMVFRLVAVPAANRLFDKKFSMGVIQPGEERGIFERRFDGYVSGPFIKEDFPKDWNEATQNLQKEGFTYYLIGKYELTNAQWQAVMGGELDDQRPELPKTQISWYQIQDFLQRYNSWLMNNHSDKMPVVEGTPAYLRLPTEEEWEYAARGGNLPPEKLDFTDFPMDEGKKIQDFAIFGSNYDKPMPIGTKLPNNLGLYDMAGNVAEIVQTPFQLTVTDSMGQKARRRLHGSSGGLITKGGSFISSSEMEMFPGRRNELKMFIRNSSNQYEPFKSRSVGCRLVLTSLNVQGSNHLKNLVNEEKKISGELSKLSKEETLDQQTDEAKQVVEGGTKKDQLLKIDRDSTPLQALDKVIQSASSPLMQSNLYQLRDIIQDNNSALERERDSNLTNSIRSALYKIDSLRSLSFRCWYLANAIKEFEKEFPPQKLTKGNKAKLEQIKKSLHDYVLLLNTATNFYKSSLKDLSDQPDKAVSQKIEQMKEEYSGKDLINEHMQQNITYLSSNLSFVRQSGLENLENMEIWNKVIPPVILNLIVPYLK